MRKSVTITVDQEGRDKGKVFVVTEMAALAAWKWGAKAASAMVRSGAELPPDILGQGIVAVLALGVFRMGFIPWAELEPLLDDLMGCVQHVPTPARPDVVRKIFPEDIEEPATYVRLAKEVFSLHTGFFPEGGPSKSPPG